MKKLLFIVLGILIIGAGLVFAFQNKQTKSKGVLNMTDEKVLVVYFSATGTTKKVAQNLAKAISGDLYEIKPLKAYTSADLNWHDNNSRTSIEMKDLKSRPEIITDDLSIKNYDTIFLGFPIWWGVAPMVVHTFLEQYDFSGKKIIIFATSGSSGLGNTANTLQQSVSKSAKIIEGDVLNSNLTAENLKQWAKKF